MMNKIILLGTLATLTACGFKGDLYLPKENDDAHFGVIQTGIDFRRPTPQTTSEPINMTPK